MSEVTNLILHIPILEDEDARIAEVNEYFVRDETNPLVSIDDEKLPRGWYGGSKMLECNLYIGAFNYLRLDDFIEHLRSSVHWEYPGEVQVIVKEQEDDLFRIETLVKALKKR